MDPLPLQLIPVQETIASQFLKFELVSWWGMGGGLQYFDVQRDGENYHLLFLFCPAFLCQQCLHSILLYFVVVYYLVANTFHFF